MKVRPTWIAILATASTLGFGTSIAQADPHFTSPVAAGRAALWSIGAPILGPAAAETRAALRDANVDLRVLRQGLRGAGFIYIFGNSGGPSLGQP